MEGKKRKLQALIQSAKLEDARKLCIKICKKDAKDHDTRFTLGMINVQLKRYANAEKCFREVIKLCPGDATAFYNLARIYEVQEQFAKAKAAYQDALKCKPDMFEACNNLGNVFRKQGDLSAACDVYRQAMKISPDNLSAHFNLGSVLWELKKFQDAINTFEWILKCDKNHFKALLALGKWHFTLGEHQTAILYFKRGFELQPESVELLYSFGLACLQMLDYAGARNYLNKVVVLQANHLAAHYNLGIAQHHLGLTVEAEKTFENISLLKPLTAEDAFCLGALEHKNGNLDKGIACYRQAVAMQPDYPAAWNNLGMVLRDVGDFMGAVEALQQALRYQPEYVNAHSNLLFVQSYNLLVSEQVLLAESKRWDVVHGALGRLDSYQYIKPDAAAEKRLRIGYVSADFREHVVSYFFEPVLDYYDKQQFEVFCYAQVKSPDAVTQRLQGKVDRWRSIVGMSDKDAARMIHDDKIDILIDLAGHTGDSRLKVFTYKPAPIQATYLGYCATTGLEAMDYWISDEVLHPEDTVELATETHYRLPRCWLCYRPHENAPEVLPVEADRVLTFGSLNEWSKLTSDVLTLWCEILLAVPESRLLLKTRALSDQTVQAQIKERFAAQGIGADRLTLLPRSEDYLSTYHEIDIALDTFPRTGGATTADALWMGVPVLTLSGERMIERQGVSMLTAVGLEELIANTKDEYVEKAVALAKDSERRKQLRGSLREQMAASPLCDARGLAQALEGAYRDMWQKFLLSDEVPYGAA